MHDQECVVVVRYASSLGSNWFLCCDSVGAGDLPRNRAAWTGEWRQPVGSESEHLEAAVVDVAKVLDADKLGQLLNRSLISPTSSIGNEEHSTSRPLLPAIFSHGRRKYLAGTCGHYSAKKRRLASKSCSKHSRGVSMKIILYQNGFDESLTT